MTDWRTLPMSKRFAVVLQPWFQLIALKDNKAYRKHPAVVELTHWSNYLAVVDDEVGEAFLKSWVWLLDETGLTRNLARDLIARLNYLTGENVPCAL